MSKHCVEMVKTLGGVRPIQESAPYIAHRILSMSSWTRQKKK